MRKLFPDNTFVSPQMPDPNRDLVRLMVGEAPGKEEAASGQPFQGGAGVWLDSMLRHAHIPRSGLTITNCIQCQPPKNIFPTDSDARIYISKEDANEAVSQCYRNHVAPMLRSRAWKRVDLLGDKPLRIVGGKDDGIFKWRGSPIEWDNLGGHQRGDRKSTRLNSSHIQKSRMPSSA